MSATFNDIRAACQAAQGRIMRLQQATNNQVGLTSSIREMWFDELRNIAQCFITAQQASAKLEQAVNTERAQLQGSLSSALNERDLRASERDATEQEVKFLQARLTEFASLVHGNPNIPNHRQQNPASARNRDSWVMTGTGSSNGDSPELIGYADAMPQLPNKVEDLPFSPQSMNGTLPAFTRNGNFTASEQGSSAIPSHNQTQRSNTPRFTGGRNRNQSKFFAKNGNGALIQRPPSAYANSSGHNTPDFINGGGPSGRFSRTPGHGSHGPFKLPPPPSASQQQNPFGAEHNQQTNQRASSMHTSSASHAHNGNSRESVTGNGAQTSFQNRNGFAAAPAPRPPMANSSRSQTPASTSKELTVVRDENGQPGEFAPGVPTQPGSMDEERVRDIFEFFNSIKDWVDKYCGFPNNEAMHSLSHQHPRLWDYACSVTYPNNRHNAASHSLFMLCNKSFRSYFITRLVIQYVVQQMWSPQAWEGLDEKLTEVLESVKHRLDLKYGYDAVLQPHERHALVEKRSRAIFDFMHQPTWNKSKAQKIYQASTRFKDILGPMMNMDTVDPQSAHHELIGICESALRLSAILNTSRLSFQFIFNECGIKFSDQSHRPLNSSIPARELQAHHWRLMCVVTPGITYRNDAGVSVDPRFLAKANVLLMQ
ncbi:hypothetical protein SEUCBS139899_006021 [Sporothrix eucalyptigena]|uniref:Uncharacterized protein n=1 Tax=Sporothrix eucalyptigena TaxID=1812306 RepID=A0ABP0D0M4_9PEZI